jgi:hypothetical protein
MRAKGKVVREYLAKIGCKGGNVLAAKYDEATLAKWAKKGES